MQRLLSFLFSFCLIIALVNCAKRGTPGGGPKDETPPKMVRAIPENYATNFNEKKIRIYFDEYVKLKDLQKQLIISPPLKNPPIITPQTGASKFIEIKLTDTLKQNTTYVFNFGQSIVDNNENNPFNFFKYVFSTGNYIDSLTVTGKVEDALSYSPPNFVSVMLYSVDSTYTDSIIYKNVPTYITNTLDSINKPFTITNVKAGTYRLVAVKDKNSDNLYNPKDDKIAFVDTLINVPSDNFYTLKLFKEIPDFKPIRPTQAAKNRIIFGYEGKPDSVTITLHNQTTDSFKYAVLKDREKDTLHYWFTPLETDSLIFTVAYNKQVDTFNIKTRELSVDSLALKSSHTGTIAPLDTLALQANTPLVSADSTKISVVNSDSIAVPFNTILQKNKNQLAIPFTTIPEQKYSITILPGAVTDLFGNSNDSLSFYITTKSLADYGNLRLVLQNNNTYPIIVQLTQKDGTVVQQKRATQNETVFEFKHLTPGNYRVRIIFDTNNNGIWDSGNFLKNIQPERVLHYPKELDVRANWELEETFILQE